MTERQHRIADALLPAFSRTNDVIGWLTAVRAIDREFDDFVRASLGAGE